MINEELEWRVKRIQKMMAEQAVDACLVTSNTNLLYLAGRMVSGYVYVLPEGEPYYFIRRPQLPEGDRQFMVRKPEVIPSMLQAAGLSLPKRLMVEADEMTHAEWLRYQAVFPEAELVDGTHSLRMVRAVKSAAELDLVRESGRLQSLAYESFPSLYRQGMSDHAFSVEMERKMRAMGNLGIVRIFGQSMEIFFGSVLAGENAQAASTFDFGLGGAGMHPSVPVGQNGTVPTEGQTFMVDICGNFNGYHVDQTRVFSVGATTEAAYRAHDVSLEIHRMFQEKARPGVACEELFEEAWSIARKHRLDDHFMGTTQQAKFVGHGIGLVLNELPVICAKNKTLLQAGMTIAWEPKFIVDGIGAVGNENTFVIRESGDAECVTTANPLIVNLKG